jgi:acetylornithine aminotransferase
VPARARRAGRLLADGLATVPGVVQVRGRGLLLAAALDGEWSRALAAAALGHGLLVNPVLPDAVRLAPSLLVSDAEIDEAVGLLRAAAEEVRP